MWRLFLLRSGGELFLCSRLLVTILALLVGGNCCFAWADREAINPPQTFLVISDAAPLMAGDEQVGTVPLGTVVKATHLQDKWRFSPDQKGWIHLSDLLPIETVVQTLTTEIETRPTARACQLRGIAYMAHRQWGRAAQDLEQAYELGASAISLHLNLGTCYEQLGQFPAAMQEYDVILKTYPEDPSALLARGNLLLQEGQFKAALRDLTQATQESPHSAEAWNAQGVALRMLGRYEKAIQAYTRAVKLDPTSADPLSNRGYARKQLGQLKQALEDYEAALALDPKSAPVRNDLAWFLATTSLASLRDGPRAVTLSEAICKESDNKNGEYLDTLAAAYACAGKFPAAVEAARLSLTVQGDNPGAARTQERLNLYLKEQPYLEVVDSPMKSESGTSTADEASSAETENQADTNTPAPEKSQ